MNKQTKLMLIILLAITLVYSYGGGFRFTANWQDIAFFSAIAVLIIFIFKKRGRIEL